MCAVRGRTDRQEGKFYDLRDLRKQADAIAALHRELIPNAENDTKGNANKCVFIEDMYVEEDYS